MPSSVDLFASTANTKALKQSNYFRPQKKQEMSVAQIYLLAHIARARLLREAAQPDCDLRLVVGHANMLDSLMPELANAQQKLHRWFNNTVSGSHKDEWNRHQHAKFSMEEADHSWEAEDVASSKEESLDEEQKLATKVVVVEVDSDPDDDDEENEDLTLVRTAPVIHCQSLASTSTEAWKTNIYHSCRSR
jgi:hypothetical protein